MNNPFVTYDRTKADAATSSTATSGIASHSMTDSKSDNPFVKRQAVAATSNTDSRNDNPFVKREIEPSNSASAMTTDTTKPSSASKGTNGASSGIGYFISSFINPFVGQSHPSNATDKKAPAPDVQSIRSNPFVNPDEIKRREEVEGNPFVDSAPRAFVSPISDEEKLRIKMAKVDLSIADRLKAGEELTREEALELTIDKMKEQMEKPEDERHQYLTKISDLEAALEAKDTKIKALEYYFRKKMRKTCRSW